MQCSHDSLSGGKATIGAGQRQAQAHRWVHRHRCLLLRLPCSACLLRHAVFVCDCPRTIQCPVRVVNLVLFFRCICRLLSVFFLLVICANQTQPDGNDMSGNINGSDPFRTEVHCSPLCSCMKAYH